jgi:hypothetical protein
MRDHLVAAIAHAIVVVLIPIRVGLVKYRQDVPLVAPRKVYHSIPTLYSQASKL